MIRKLGALLLACTLLLTAACSGTKPPETGGTDEKQPEKPALPVLSAMEVLEREKTYAAEHVGREPVLPQDFVPEERVDPSTIRGKVLCGYQGWFGCKGDSCGVDGWIHWAGDFTQIHPHHGKKPGFDLYPDMTDYPEENRTPIGFRKTGDDRAPCLFSSCDAETVDLHFRWMQEYGIDGVALQRFAASALGKGVSHYNTMAGHVKNAAEKYGRVFYLCYDLSGAAEDRDWDGALEKDFAEVIEGELALTSSPQYLHEDGKPVIQLWGVGFASRKIGPARAAAFIQWFKDRGFYVIGGTPTHWRKGTGDADPAYREVYELFDMISPWTVGRFRDSSEAAYHYRHRVLPDLEETQNRGQAYMPVIFSGFAWSNRKGGARNEIPRRAGELLRQQMKLCAEAEVPCVYVAMFDEYDESTAVMKAADSSYALPRRDYFLTTSADGVYVSGDYYLRLVGKFTALYKKGEGPGDELMLPLTCGPIWLRTGLEEGMDALPDLTQNPLCSNIEAKAELRQDETAPLFPTVLHFSGKAEAGASFEQKIMELGIPVSENTKFRYIKKDCDEASSPAALDLLFSDGTRLSDAAVTDQRGLAVGAAYRARPEAFADQKPANVREPVWQDFRYNVGAVCSGKTVTGILLCYESEEGGVIDAAFDDIILSDGAIAETDLAAPFEIE